MSTSNVAAALRVFVLTAGMRLSSLGHGVAQQASAPTTGAAIPSDDRIREILVKRIDADKQGIGIVVGVFEPGGRRIVSYGSVGREMLDR